MFSAAAAEDAHVAIGMARWASRDPPALRLARPPLQETCEAPLPVLVDDDSDRLVRMARLPRLGIVSPFKLAVWGAPAARPPDGASAALETDLDRGRPGTCAASGPISGTPNSAGSQALIEGTVQDRMLARFGTPALLTRTPYHL